MDRAYSVIFFTTASGAGYGLLVLLSFFAIGDPVVDRWFGVTAFGIAFALVTLGLLASLFHLGHPERAWRALSQWKSSWLSREGVMAILTFIPAGLLAIAWVFLEDVGGMFRFAAWITILFAATTVYCTGMIYNSLKAIPAWADGNVPWIYLLLAIYSGAVILNFLVSIFAYYSPSLVMFTIAALIGSVFMKMRYWQSIDQATPESTVGSATGLDQLGKARFLDPPHTQANYLQKEMGYAIARKHAMKLRGMALMLTCVVPFLLLCLQFFLEGIASAPLAALTLAALGPGLFIERWLFFAEAKHKVTLYYGADAI